MENLIINGGCSSMIDGFFFIISVEWVEKFDETS
jgi:hypothetical protein